MNKQLTACLFIFFVLFPIYGFSAISEEVKEVTGGQLSPTTDAGKMALELSELTSTALYHLDEEQIDQTILVMLRTNQRLKAVKVVDYATQDVVTSFYRSKSDNLVQGTFPQPFKHYQTAKAVISYQDAIIGLVEIRFQSKEDANRIDVLSNNLFILLIGCFVFFFLLVVIFRLLSKNIGGNLYLTFGTHKFAKLIFGAISAFVLISVASSWLILERNKSNIMQRSADAFHQYLGSFEQALSNLHSIREKTFRHILGKSEFQYYFHGISNAVVSKDLQAERYYCNEMDEFWLKYREFGGSGTKTIVTPNLNVIYSQGDPLNINDIPSHGSGRLSQSLNGYSELFPIDGSYNSETGSMDYRLIFATPVFDKSTDAVIAVVLIEINETEISYNDLSMYDFSRSGEMMVFDRNGLILSKPRFVLEPTSIVQDRLFIKDLLGQLEKHGIENDLAGVHKLIDYRGQETYAMLNWNADLNVALVVKMDIDEILEDYYQFRKGLFFVVLLMVLFTIPCLLFTLYAGNLTNQRLKESRREIINRLGHAAEFKDNETALHIFRMSRYSEVLARNLKMPKDWVELICDAAPMHDIGKIGVPDSILQKPGKLTPEEWDTMKKHPKFGADIIGNHSDSKLLNTAREIALYHHEKWDGSGYPEGLSGEAIPLVARIVAIADVFDALTSTRPYKRAWSFDEAIGLIIDESGRHFDPTLVKVFIESLAEFKYVMYTYRDESIKDKPS
ncbi:putative two-component system response regulator [Vibrio crassostreae]|nr:putative two-component system response regulator [Vibrio crassostreae]CAK3155927.1 putative two-component system response regulator [Vibrio crassostreae]CAK3349211.1 putative two-component system response regulator [Vibrio crassostreae]CAK3646834.1 putative two-component system response regulator [Vibrio crassostreae]CAK3684099.1 putative two-component system response regulator [Vibrio crassostreae]